MEKKVVIVGASITGVNVMGELVKNKFDGHISLIDQKDVLPYNPYPLSKEWMVDSQDMDPPLLKKESYYKENNIDLRLNTRVESVNWREKTIRTHDNEVIPYDYLVIATGSKLRKISLPGDDAKGIFYLREFKDARKIKEWLKDVEDVAIVGSGFIGLEFASTFSQLGKKVSLLVRSGRPLEKILGPDLSEYFIRMHEGHGVEFLFNEETEEFIKDSEGKIKAIQTKTGKTIKTDMVIMAVGVVPNLSLEIDSLNIDRGIIVNEYGESSLEDIYAGGDVVLWPYRGELIHIEHWENAWGQGISIAKNILNKGSSEYKTNPYFWTDQYDETFEYLGHAKEWDKTFIRGSLEDKKFALAYVDKDNYPLGILFANKFEKRKDVEGLLNQNQPLDGHKFADISVAIDKSTLKEI